MSFSSAGNPLKRLKNQCLKHLHINEIVTLKCDKNKEMAPSPITNVPLNLLHPPCVQRVADPDKVT